MFGATVPVIEWSALNLDGVAVFDAIINLAGYSIADQRWKPSVKQRIKTSRVHTTQQLAALCARLGPAAPYLLNASATGIYGTQAASAAPHRIDENQALTFPPNDFASEITQAWEAALSPAIDAGCTVSTMRFGVIVTQTGGVLAKLLPSVKWGLASVIGSGHQGISWMHMRDAIAAIAHLLAHPTLGPFNFTSPHPLTQRDFIRAVAKAYHRPCFLRTPAIVLKLLLGQLADEFLIRGQWVYPQRLLDSGFHFQYPHLHEALAVETA